MTDQSAEQLKDLYTRLHNYGLGSWAGKSTTTLGQQLLIAQACVDALDQFDRYEKEISLLKQEIASWKAVAHDHSERLKKLDQRLTVCSEMLLRHACYCGSKSRDVNMHGEQCPYRRAFDVTAPVCIHEWIADGDGDHHCTKCGATYMQST